MIRGKLYKEINTILGNHPRFDISDFAVEATKDKDDPEVRHTVLTITYSLEPKYKIIFLIPVSTTNTTSYGEYYALSGFMCPGPLSLEETFAFRGEDGIMQKLTIWLKNVWEELLSNPIIKEIEKQKQEIDDLSDKFSSLKDEYFSKEEAEDIKSRLDKLEQNFEAEISEVTEDKVELEKEIAKLHTDIDTLKQTVESLMKKNWLKSFTGKFFKWTQKADNRKLLKDGYSLVREFLPEDYKKALPDIDPK